MLCGYKNAVIAATMFLAPVAANAATISGQIDISGNVNLGGSSFNSAGTVDFDPNTGVVLGATDDFASSVSFLDLVALTDIDFSAVNTVWEVGGFSFVSGVFSDFQDGLFKSFTATGVISHANFDDTVARLTFTAQENLGAVNVSFSTTTVPTGGDLAPVPLPAAGSMLVLGLGGLFAARRRKSTKAEAA